MAIKYSQDQTVIIDGVVTGQDQFTLKAVDANAQNFQKIQSPDALPADPGTTLVNQNNLNAAVDGKVSSPDNTPTNRIGVFGEADHTIKAPDTILSAGGKRIIELAPGESVSDATTLQQLIDVVGFATADKATAPLNTNENALAVFGATARTLKEQDSDISLKNKKITALADGTASTDAVTFQQLLAATEPVYAIGQDNTGNTLSYTYDSITDQFGYSDYADAAQSPITSTTITALTSYAGGSKTLIEVASLTDFEKGSIVYTANDGLLPPWISSQVYVVEEVVTSGATGLVVNKAFQANTVTSGNISRYNSLTFQGASNIALSFEFFSASNTSTGYFGTVQNYTAAASGGTDFTDLTNPAGMGPQRSVYVKLTGSYNGIYKVGPTITNGYRIPMQFTGTGSGTFEFGLYSLVATIETTSLPIISAYASLRGGLAFTNVGWQTRWVRNRGGTEAVLNERAHYTASGQIAHSDHQIIDVAQQNDKYYLQIKIPSSAASFPITSPYYSFKK